MSEMTTQEMINALSLGYDREWCHIAQWRADKIAARLKALEEALREFVYLNSYYADADDAAYRQAMVSSIQESSAILDTVREVE